MNFFYLHLIYLSADDFIFSCYFTAHVGDQPLGYEVR
jgi:hypothetical protein